MYTTKFKHFGKFSGDLTKHHFQALMCLYPLKLLLWIIQTLQGSLTAFVPYGNTILRYLSIGVFAFWVLLFFKIEVVLYLLLLFCSSSALAVGQWLELFRVCKDFSFLNSIQLKLAHLQVACWTTWTWVILSNINYSNSGDSVNTPSLNWATLSCVVRVFRHLYTEENGLKPCQ